MVVGYEGEAFHDYAFRKLFDPTQQIPIYDTNCYEPHRYPKKLLLITCYLKFMYIYILYIIYIIFRH